MSTSEQQRQDALTAFSLLDLTSLTDTETDEDIKALCDNAVWRSADGETKAQVAALCVFPRFVPLARKYLDAIDAYGVRIATVTNFPAGGDDIDIAVKETRAAVSYGADEVDLVFPYRAFMAGDETLARQMIQACKATCGAKALLKVILETGELKDENLIRGASQLAISAGADFIKTSTGKVDVNATPEAAEIMLKAIQAHTDKPVGFKPAGGVKTLEDALTYMNATRAALGESELNSGRFRIGASSVRKNLVAVLEGSSQSEQTGY